MPLGSFDRRLLNLCVLYHSTAFQQVSAVAIKLIREKSRIVDVQQNVKLNYLQSKFSPVSVTKCFNKTES